MRLYEKILKFAVSWFAFYASITHAATNSKANSELNNQGADVMGSHADFLNRLMATGHASMEFQLSEEYGQLKTEIKPKREAETSTKKSVATKTEKSQAKLCWKKIPT